jgi:phage terminase large subunit GpA-like protein
MKVSEWADQYRILSSVASGEAGRYRTSRVPYWREVMDSLSPHSPVRQTTLMKGSQIGASELGLTWLGYIMSPHSGVGGPAMLVQPTIDLAGRFVRTRLDPMITDTPVLAERVLRGGGGTSKSQGSSVGLKLWPGGSLVTIGANSGSGLRSSPAKWIMFDEADAAPLVVENEGDPLELIRARQRTFSGRKLFVLSTPTNAGQSRIEKEFLAGDQRHYHVPCPSCHRMQTIAWERLRYPDDQHLEGNVWLECLHCNGRIDEHHKTWMLEAGEWVPDAPENAGLHRSYQLGSLYAPLGWTSWAEVVEEYLKVKGHPEGLRAWVNTAIGDTWKDTSGDRPEWEALFAQREGFPPGEVPARAIALTVGVDVQKDRLEAAVCAWGERLEMWCIDYRIFTGDPSDLDGEHSPWRQLEILLYQQFPVTGSTATETVHAVGVDTGYATASVYDWWKRQGRARGVHLLKGVERAQQLVSRPQTLTHSRVRGAAGVVLHTVGTSLAKKELFGHLRLRAPDDPSLPNPTGLRHYPIAPWASEEFFRQLTAEVHAVRVNRAGYEVRRWEKRHQRNEVLDCHVYARAAAALLNLDRLTGQHVHEAHVRRVEPHRAKPKATQWKRWRR